MAAPQFQFDRLASDNKHWLMDPHAITNCLEGLSQDRAVITVYIDNTELFFLSALLAVDTEIKQFFIDQANDPKLNIAASTARQITMTTRLNGVLIEVRTPALSATMRGPIPCLAAPLPQKIIRQQRRDYFRVSTPQGHSLVCEFRLGSTSFRLPVSDISTGGLGLVAKTAHLQDFLPGTVLSGCRLTLPESPPLALAMTVRKTLVRRSRSGLDQLHIGCVFGDLTFQKQNQIDRYITRVERERKARTSGWG
jgi:flagellar brake protein